MRKQNAQWTQLVKTKVVLITTWRRRQMSRNKNFTINRTKDTDKVMLGSLEIGSVFEREGNLHMLVDVKRAELKAPDAFICNLNTGATWRVWQEEMVIPVRDCTINYRVSGYE